jgi:hypothetical protein
VEVAEKLRAGMSTVGFEQGYTRLLQAMKTAEARLADPAAGAAVVLLLLLLLLVVPAAAAVTAALARALNATSLGATKVTLRVVGCRGRMVVLPVTASETRLTYHTELDLRRSRHNSWELKDRMQALY